MNNNGECGCVEEVDVLWMMKGVSPVSKMAMIDQRQLKYPTKEKDLWKRSKGNGRGVFLKGKGGKKSDFFF